MADPARGGRRSLPARLFTRGSWPESNRVITILHKETVGGAILLASAAIALIWANSPWWASYHALTNFRVGSDDFGLHLNLSLGLDLARPRPTLAEALALTSTWTWTSWA